MGCCISRIKDTEDKSFEEEESQDNPFKIFKGYTGGKVASAIKEITKKKKFFERLDETVYSKYETGSYVDGEQEGLNMKMNMEISKDWDSLFNEEDRLEKDTNTFNNKNIQYTLNRSRKSLPKETNIRNINININLKYTNTKFRKRKQTLIIKSRSKSRSRSPHKNNNSYESKLNISSDYNFSKVTSSASPIININIVNPDNSVSNNNSFQENSFDYLNNKNVQNKSYTNSIKTSSSRADSPKRDYFSICSHKFYRSKSIRSQGEEDKNIKPEKVSETDLILTTQNNCFLRDSFTFLYFEIDYLMIWVKDYLKSIYSELNFILLIQIDDDPETTETIYLNKTIENFKYVPMLKKENYLYLNKNFKFVKILKRNKLSEVHKIRLTLCTYVKGVLIPISSEDIYLNTKIENQMCKYKMYRNMNMIHNNKKIANILFSFIYQNEYHDEEFKQEENYLIRKFSSIENLSILEEESQLEFVFHHIPNIDLPPVIDLKKTNLKIENIFFSINDIEDIDMSGELTGKGVQINIDKLLDFLLIVKKKYDFYELLIKLNDCLSKKEFNEDKLFSFKEKLIKRFIEIIKFNENAEIIEVEDSKFFLDIILIPKIFLTLKNLFTKLNKFGIINRMSNNNLTKLKKIKRISDNEISFDLNDINEINKDDPEKTLDDNSILNNNKDTDIKYSKLQKFHRMKNFNLLLKSFLLSLDIIQLYKQLTLEIIIATLNYLSKILENENFEIDFKIDEDIINFTFIDEIKNSEELFINILTDKNIDKTLWNILNIYTKIEGCILPITQIFSKILKKNPLVLVSKFNPESNYLVTIKEVLLSLSSNSKIITNSMFILLNLIDYIPVDQFVSIINFKILKDIFFNFSLNNFDIVHESSLQLIKAVLTKKNNYFINYEDYTEIINIFSFALILLKNKIIQLDLLRLSKSLFNLMTVIYTIVNIISKDKDTERARVICNEKKIPELIIEVFYSIYEKNIFGNLDEHYGNNNTFDVNLLNTKTIIFRTLFHCVNLINNMKFESGGIKSSAEKMYKIIKNIEDNDTLYHPVRVLKEIHKNYKVNSGISKDKYLNLLSIQKNLLDYYSRYKTVLPEFIRNLIKILKS